MSDVESCGLAEFVREIERITTKSMIVEPKIIDLKHERPGVYGVVLPAPAGQSNEIKRFVAEPVWHNELLETPSELVAFIKTLANSRKLPAENGVVYVGRDAVTYHYTFADRRDRATVELLNSVPWKWLTGKTEAMNQKALVRLLRITFAGCVSDNDKWMIDFFRNVKVSTEGEYEGRVQRGSEALGRNIQAVLKDNDKLPEEITLQVNVFENYNLRVPVRCAIEVEVGSGEPRFELLPFPNQLQTALESTLVSIQGVMENSEAPVFIGSNRGGE